MLARRGLTSSEWSNALKLSMNSMSNRGTGGRSVGNRLCRNPSCGEKKLIETIPHIRGFCPRSEALRNAAHHKVRTSVANLFRNQGWEVYEEVHCEAISEDGSRQNRRADIVAINRQKDKGLIVDPTLRWEGNDDDQDEAVNKEKRDIYLPTIPYFKNKYGIKHWDVFGLWFGVRGTVSPFLMKFYQDNNFKKNQMKELALIVLKDTLNIINRHLYSN
ncbi:hypothetical protein WDU94_002898 [Cyamophila willieti]